MTAAQGFTPEQLANVIGWLSPEARERLGWRRSNEGQWYQIFHGTIYAEFVPYAAHAATAFEVEGELIRSGMFQVSFDNYEPNGGERWAWRAWEHHMIPHGDGLDRFTAAHDALAQIKERSNAN